MGVCRPCRSRRAERDKNETNESRRLAYLENKTVILARNKLSREKHRETCAERSRSYYLANKSEMIKNSTDRKRRLREQGTMPPRSDREKASRKRWYSQCAEKVLLSKARGRSKREGWEIDIEESDIVVPTICPMLHIPIRRDLLGTRADGQPSLDRIDSSKGYVKGNVWVISWRANRIKNCLSFPELVLFVLGLLPHVVRNPGLLMLPLRKTG